MRFCEESKGLGADILGTEIREAIMKPFRGNLSASKDNTNTLEIPCPVEAHSPRVHLQAFCYRICK